MHRMRFALPFVLSAVCLLGCKKGERAPSAGDFREAAEQGDLRTVQRYVESGGDVNYRFDTGRRGGGQTALHFAAFEGHVEVVALLLKANADPNAKDRMGETPLVRAVRGIESKPVITDLLLKAGADVDAANPGEWTALTSAAYSCKLEHVRRLLEAGANVNARDKANNSPLHIAAMRDNGTRQEVLTLLLKAGADPNAQNDQGLTYDDLLTKNAKQPPQKTESDQ